MTVPQIARSTLPTAYATPYPIEGTELLATSCTAASAGVAVQRAGAHAEQHARMQFENPAPDHDAEQQ